MGEVIFASSGAQSGAHTPPIVEGVMNRVLAAIATIWWNQTQTPWGPNWIEGSSYTNLAIRNIKVVVETFNEGYGAVDKMLHVEFKGERVSTWLDSKREFYHAYLPDGWDDYKFVDWARGIFEDLGG